MSVHHVTDANFQSEVLKADGPVVVDFWAEWCPPCKALSPLVDELATEQKKVKVVKINIDHAPETPTKYGVRGIPTLMVFKDGAVVDTRVGGMSKQQLTDWINSVV
ncbi:MAG: thioredoxin [Rhodospirillales bacterium]|nr:thioredoxin [Rhodospirillales bacterium]